MADDSDPGKLFAALEERAREERGRVDAEAAERASLIIADARREAERIRATARQDLRRELIVEGRRLLGEAHGEARRESLRVKRALLAEVLAGAQAEIGRLKAGSGYREALDALCAEARAFIGEPCSVEVQAEDAQVMVASADGRRRADNSLSTRIAAVMTRDEPQVAKILFGAGRSRDGASRNMSSAGQAAKGGSSP